MTMEAAYASEMLVNFYQIAWCNITEDSLHERYQIGFTSTGIAITLNSVKISQVVQKLKGGHAHIMVIT
jgi:hypothetical protein